MRKATFSETQIVAILKDAESGVPGLCCGSMASAERPSSSGGVGTAARRSPM